MGLVDMSMREGDRGLDHDGQVGAGRWDRKSLIESTGTDSP